MSTSLTECSTLGLTVFPLNTSTTFVGTPPYYLTAAEIGGVPTTDNIGTDPANLQWTVNHKAGTKLFLEVHDSKGISAGVGGTLFTVAGTCYLLLPDPLPTVWYSRPLCMSPHTPIKPAHDPSERDDDDPDLRALGPDDHRRRRS